MTFIGIKSSISLIDYSGSMIYYLMIHTLTKHTEIVIDINEDFMVILEIILLLGRF